MSHRKHTKNHSNQGRRLFNLQLGKYTLAFTGATGKEDIQTIKNLKKLHGEKWVSAWLKKRDVIH